MAAGLDHNIVPCSHLVYSCQDFLFDVLGFYFFPFFDSVSLFSYPAVDLSISRCLCTNSPIYIYHIYVLLYVLKRNDCNAAPSIYTKASNLNNTNFQRRFAPLMAGDSAQYVFSLVCDDEVLQVANRVNCSEQVLNIRDNP